MMKWLVVLLMLSAPAAPGQVLKIYAIDVGQGDATLVVSPSGKTLLIDSGGSGKEAPISSVLASAGVSTIDHYVTTHYHLDHYGGIPGLAANPAITIGQVHDRGDTAFLPVDKRASSSFRAYEKSVGFRAHHLMRGETIGIDNLVSAVCIASGGAVLGEPDTHTTGLDENDMSIALLITFSGFHFFVGGDIERPTEQDITAEHLVQGVDLYQANHHGSESSSSLAFLSDLRPTVVIISNGDNSSYRHPRKVTLDTLAMLTPPPVVLQTNKLFKVMSDGGNVNDRFIADPETVDDDGTIVVTAGLSTRTMTVSYRDTSFTLPWKEGAAEPAARVVIEKLLPDPAGLDRDLEEVTVRNDGTAQVDLTQWYLMDAGGSVWSLSILGSLAPGAAGTVLRAGMAMSLGNEGDTIILFDGDHAEHDRFTYAGAVEGVSVVTGH